MQLQRIMFPIFSYAKKIAIICVLLLASCFPVLKAEVPERYKIDNPEGRGELFLGGVYMYTNGFGSKETMDAHLRYLAQNGITHVFAAVSLTMTDPTPAELIDMCEKYGLHISFQLDDAYISTANDFTTAKPQTAATFINNYDGLAVLAYSVKEEPPSNDPDNFIDDLLDHYSLITSYCIGYSTNDPAPMYLLQSDLIAIEDANANTTGQQPVATGLDRYFVKWSFSASGYIVTPSKVLSLQEGISTPGSFPDFRTETRSNQYFTAVISCNTRRQTYTKSYLQTTYPSYYSEWLTLAQNDNQGLSEDGDNIKIWSYYRPPQNLTRAMMWQTIAFGSHGIMNWSCNPIATSVYVGLLGPDFKNSDVFNEFTATIRELQPYAWIINRMDLSANTGVIASPDSLVWTGNFTLNGYDAHIAVVVNGDVGTWANDSKTTFLARTQNYRIDDDGNLIDYTPYTNARTLTLTNQQAGLGSMYDLATGQLIGSSSGTIDLEPGQGKFVWIGDSSDLEKVRFACGFTGLIKLVGYMNGSSELPRHIRSIYPVDDFSNNSGYVVKTQDIEQGRRYRLHITASSSNGASLGVYKVGYDSSGQPVAGIPLSIGIWNQVLTSTSQTFTSDEFEIDHVDVEYPRILYYRSNQTGTLEIQDAWLEDVDHQEQITTYYKNFSTVQLEPAKTYRLHVKARKLYSDYNNSGLGMYVYNYRLNGGGYEMYQAASIYWNTTALSENVQEFTSNTFTAYDGQASFLTVSLYNIHYNRESGETLIVEKAWVEEIQ